MPEIKWESRARTGKGNRHGQTFVLEREKGKDVIFLKRKKEKNNIHTAKGWEIPSKKV